MYKGINELLWKKSEKYIKQSGKFATSLVSPYILKSIKSLKMKNNCSHNLLKSKKCLHV